MKEFRLKGSDRFLKIIYSFSATEKVIFGILLIVAILTSIIMAYRVNSMFLVPIPSYGGSFSEGMIGLPRSINSVLAFTDTDKGLSTLIYSGLMKYQNGELIPDLAESYKVSDDGLVYTFRLKANLQFHDGESLTADDVEFTIQKIQDGEIKSPYRVDWASIGIKKISASEIQFILKQPYSPFLANTTVGIMPKHIWKNLSADQFLFSEKNHEAIGSGPYKIDSIEKDSTGNPASYSLSAFSKYHFGRPYISNIKIYFYQNKDGMINAYKSNLIENLADISPQNTYQISTTTNRSTIIHNPLPRIFAIFLNQNNSPVLANKEIRRALNMAVDKDKIIKEVLYGYGVRLDSPLPINSNSTTSTSSSLEKSDKDGAKSLLTKSGWTINERGILEKKIGATKQTLELSIVTADSPELKMVAEIIKKDWEDLGAKVTIKVYEYGDLSQNIIKTRKYDALLFGEIINKDLDLYAFWHSSQRNSPGLNLAMYVNSKIDKLLEDSRITPDKIQRDNIYESLQKIIKDDMPAIFLYSPDYIYIMSNKINGYNIKSITSHSERFYGIEKWYITTDQVWKIFINKK